MTAIVITPAPSDPPLFVESLTARGTKTRAREVQRILAELSDADRANIADGATRAAAGGWPDGPVYKVGDRLLVDGRQGTLVSFPSQYLGVRFDGEKHTSRCHPTWRVSPAEAAR